MSRDPATLILTRSEEDSSSRTTVLTARDSASGVEVELRRREFWGDQDFWGGPRPGGLPWDHDIRMLFRLPETQNESTWLDASASIELRHGDLPRLPIIAHLFSQIVAEAALQGLVKAGDLGSEGPDDQA